MGKNLLLSLRYNKQTQTNNQMNKNRIQIITLILLNQFILSDITKALTELDLWRLLVKMDGC